VYFRELGYQQDGCKNTALVPLVFSRNAQPCTELGFNAIEGCFVLKPSLIFALYFADSSFTLVSPSQGVPLILSGK
jgi:hypothetical protein